MPKSFVPPEQYYPQLVKNSASTSPSGGYSSWTTRPTKATGETPSCSSTTGASSEETALADVPSTDEGRGVVLVDPSELDRVTIARLATRIRSALTARATGGIVEAVNGESR